MTAEQPKSATETAAIFSRPRRWGILLPKRDTHGRELTSANGHPLYPDLSCPEGHSIGWEWNLLGDGFPRCSHGWENRRECGLRLWVCPMPRRAKPGSPRFIVAEVDGREIVYMQHTTWSPTTSSGGSASSGRRGRLRTHRRSGVDF